MDINEDRHCRATESVIELDLATAAEPIVDQWRAVENAALAVDLPGDPTYLATGFREVRSVTSSRVRSRHLAVATDEGLAAVARLRLHDAPNSDHADVQIVVHPAHRRKGIGSSLLAAVLERATSSGVHTVQADIPAAESGGFTGEAFAVRHGFTRTLVEFRSLQSLAAARRHQHLAARRHPPYRLVHHAGWLPAELMEPFAIAVDAMREAPPPTAGFDLGGWSVAQVQSMFDAADQRGETMHVVCALFEEPAGTVVAALTVLVVSPTRPSRAEQSYTLVAPEHRGHGLGVWVKANAALIAADQHPALTEILTWNGAENEHMLRVNAELGYQLDRPWVTWSRCVPPAVAD